MQHSITTRFCGRSEWSGESVLYQGIGNSLKPARTPFPGTPAPSDFRINSGHVPPMDRYRNSKRDLSIYTVTLFRAMLA